MHLRTLATSLLVPASLSLRERRFRAWIATCTTMCPTVAMRPQRESCAPSHSPLQPTAAHFPRLFGSSAPRPRPTICRSQEAPVSREKAVDWRRQLFRAAISHFTSQAHATGLKAAPRLECGKKHQSINKSCALTSTS